MGEPTMRRMRCQVVMNRFQEPSMMPTAEIEVPIDEGLDPIRQKSPDD